jgi:hypothetical protein
MTRIAIAGALVFAALGAACQNAGDEEVQIAGLGSGGTGFTNTVGSPVRGYTIVNGAGGQGALVETHAVVYRHPTTSSVQRRTGTPLGAATNLGGNVLQDSAPWGYRRVDNVDCVLYIDVNRHVHEISRTGFSFTDLDYSAPPINAPLAFGGQFNGPVPDAIGYVRAGNRAAVVYRSSNNHVIEILRVPFANPSWIVNDLTALSGTQFIVGKGSAFPYARSDGYNTIVYVANDNHVHELATFGTPSSGTGAWSDADLSFAAGTFTEPTSDAWGYKRSDNCNAVVYATDGNLHQLALCPGGGWSYSLLPTASPALGGLHRRPSGYVRADGVTTVVYVGFDDSIH